MFIQKALQFVSRRNPTVVRLARLLEQDRQSRGEAGGGRCCLVIALEQLPQAALRLVHKSECRPAAA